MRTIGICCLGTMAALALLCACRPGGGDTTMGVMGPFYGDYRVTFAGRVGGPYEPSNSLVSGTTMGIQTIALPGTITLSPSEPGVISVPEGETIPGVAPEDVIYGAAYMQNPLHVFMGTDAASRTGDFGIFSMVRFGLPAGIVSLDYTGSKGGGGPFGYVPVFFESTTPSGDSVNLVYWTIQVSGDQTSMSVTGKLVDRHVAEAAAANLFSVPIESPILGTMIDSFMLSNGATFDCRVTGTAISGRIIGSGTSVAGLAPQVAVFEITFQGTKVP